MQYAKITGTGGYLPEKILTNHDLEKMVDTSDEWIVTRSGIHERHIAAKDETPASMSEMAARQAIEVANIDPKEIELIIVATCTPEKFLPNTACLLQARLGVGQSIAFDVSAACTGFIYALDIASQYIRAGVVTKALVVGAEVLSRATNWEDRNTCVLFGDGAGAVVLEASNALGVIGSKLYADGTYQKLLDCPSGLYDNPGYITMQGREVFKIAVNGMAEAVMDLLAEISMDVSEIDWIIPHQANSRIINLVAQKLKVPNEKLVLRVGRHANTSAASIPLALNEAVRAGDVKKGDIVMMAAFGGGLTWGASVLRY